MSLFSHLLHLMSGKSPLMKTVQEVQAAMASGKKPSAIIGAKIARHLASLLPPNTRNVVESLDQLIPDSMEQKMGVTPEIKAFIKDSLRQYQASAEQKASVSPVA